MIETTGALDPFETFLTSILTSSTQLGYQRTSAST